MAVETGTDVLEMIELKEMKQRCEKLEEEIKTLQCKLILLLEEKVAKLEDDLKREREKSFPELDEMTNY